MKKVSYSLFFLLKNHLHPFIFSLLTWIMTDTQKTQKKRKSPQEDTKTKMSGKKRPRVGQKVWIVLSETHNDSYGDPESGSTTTEIDKVHTVAAQAYLQAIRYNQGRYEDARERHGYIRVKDLERARKRYQEEDAKENAAIEAALKAHDEDSLLTIYEQSLQKAYYGGQGEFTKSCSYDVYLVSEHVLDE
jgi:hypothetical protein